MLLLRKVGKPTDTIAICGAGPVGLYMMLRLLENTNYSVTLIEKRESFEREHQVSIEQGIWDALPTEIKRRQRQCMNYSPSKSIPIWCFASRVSDENVTVKINTLQQAMFEYIFEKYPLRANVVFGEITEVSPQDGVLRVTKNDQITRNPIYFKHLIGCDGSHSATNRLAVHTDYQPLTYPKQLHGVVIILKIHGLPPMLQKPNDTQRRWSELAPRQQRYVINRQQTDDVYVGINITEDELERFDRISNDTDMRTAFVRRYISPLLDLQNIPSNNINYNRIKMSVFPMVIRYAKEPFITNNGHSVILVGDSAAQTHFFTGYGLNAGIHSADEVMSYILQGKVTSTSARHQYRKFIAQAGADIAKRMRNIYIDWDVIQSICDAKRDGEVRHQARAKNILGWKSLQKNELCKMIGKDL
jgi:2-polyprenyl-6-methoxyphenol hydroxylase-like FAD-dependent oxidoreductase